MLRFTYFIIAIYALMTLGAKADTFRIGAWNIQDLHHKENFKLRDFSSVRKSDDFDLLLKYRDQFGRDAQPADLIALQEMGTKAAMERIFPPADYLTLMSSRWENDDAAEGEGKVYTGIAIRKSSGIEFIEQDDLIDLSVTHSDGNKVRTGTAALVKLNGKPLWFMSVHLKSSCSNVERAHLSTDDDCETLWKQMEPLTSWIKARQAEGIPFIIAGDFNRRFRKFTNSKPVWSVLNGVNPGDDIIDPWVTRHPETVTRKCPTRKGRSTQPIDWFLIDTSIVHWFVEGSFWERRFTQTDVDKSPKGLSDHCPISVDLNIE